MEIEILLQRVLVPFVASAIGCMMLATADSGDDQYDDEPAPRFAIRTILGGLLCGAGMIASDLWGRGVILDPDKWREWTAKYQWEWMIWAVPTSIFVMAVSRSLFSIPNRFVAVGSVVSASLAVGILFVCLNEGTFTEDRASDLMPWFGLAVLAIFWNTFSINSIASSGGSRWAPLVLVGQFGAIATLVLQAYGSLGEWCLVGSAVMVGASSAALIRGSTAKLHFGWPLSVVTVPLAIMAVACLVVSRFFESPTIPNWLLGCVLFFPTLVGVIDLLIGRIANPWVRAILAALGCSALLAAIFYFAPPIQSEW
jgi:hypothetical protein